MSAASAPAGAGVGGEDDGSKKKTKEEAAVDAFLESHDRWRKLDFALHQIEGSEERCPGAFDSVDPMEYARDLLTMEEEGVKFEDLPTPEQWAASHRHPSIRRSRLESLLRRRQRMAMHDLDEKSSLDELGLPDLCEGVLRHLRSMTFMTLEELSDVMFRPGMKFRGNICLPGMLSSARGNNHGGGDESDADGDGDEQGDDVGVRNGERNDDTTAQNQEGEAYELLITDRGEDALGNHYILATHSAYTDEQCVYIQFEIRDFEKEGLKDGKGFRGDLPIASSGRKQHGEDAARWRLEVEWADGETCCFGYWNPKEMRLEGHARQRLQANRGPFHAVDEVTHVFALYPCTPLFPEGRVASQTEAGSDEPAGQQWYSSTGHFERDFLSVDMKAIVAHRHRTLIALMNCLEACTALFEVVHISTHDLRRIQDATLYGIQTLTERLDEKQRLLWRLQSHHIEWTTLLANSRRHVCERWCAEFRRIASLLDATDFNAMPVADKFDFFDRWERANLDLVVANKEKNACELLLRSFGQMISVFQNAGRTFILGLAMTQQRLHSSYGLLRSAYQRAEVRHSMSTLGD